MKYEIIMENDFVKGVCVKMSVVESLLFTRCLRHYAETGECELDRELAKKLIDEVNKTKEQKRTALTDCLWK